MDTPSNLNAEMSILGRMIRFGDRAHEIAAQLRDEHFHSARHKIIFAELCQDRANLLAKPPDHFEPT